MYQTDERCHGIWLRKPTEWRQSGGTLARLRIVMGTGKNATNSELTKEVAGSIDPITLTRKPNIHKGQSRPVLTCKREGFLGCRRDAYNV